MSRLVATRVVAGLALALATAPAGAAQAAADPPRLILPNIRAFEPDSDGAPVVVNLTLDRPNPYDRPISVLVGDYSMVPVRGSSPPRTYGTARPGEDYAGFSPFRITWAPGQQVARLEIKLLGDTAHERVEEIDVRFGAADGVLVGDNDIDLNIVDGDSDVRSPLAPPLIGLTDATLVEPYVGCPVQRVSVLLSRPNTSSRPVSAIVGDYTSVVVRGSNPPRTYGTATPGVDYLTFPQFRLSFPPGSQSATFDVRICGDSDPEPDEHINVRVSGADGLAIEDNDLSIVLNNDDLGAWK